MAIYVWVDDQLKALQARGVRLPKPQRYQKATLSELLSQALLRPYFPSLPYLSRFLRVLQNAQALLAHLALRLAQGPSLLHMVEHKIRASPVTKPLPVAHGHRIRGYALPGSGIGVGPLGGFAGYTLVGVMNDRGLCKLALRADSPLGLLPGNARETWAEGLLEGLEHVLGDRGGKLGPSGLTRWVEGVLTPPYRLRGGRVVETGWQKWVSRRLCSWEGSGTGSRPASA